MGSNFLVSKLSLVWARLTLSKVTIAYTVFTIVHTLVQIALQADAFVLNNHADFLLKDIFRSAGFPIPVGINLVESNGEVVSCDGNHVCVTVWSPNAKWSNETSLGGNIALSATTYTTDTSTLSSSTVGTAAFGGAIALTTSSVPASITSPSVSITLTSSLAQSTSTVLNLTTTEGGVEGLVSTSSLPTSTTTSASSTTESSGSVAPSTTTDVNARSTSTTKVANDSTSPTASPATTSSTKVGKHNTDDDNDDDEKHTEQHSSTVSKTNPATITTTSTSSAKPTGTSTSSDTNDLVLPLPIPISIALPRAKRSSEDDDSSARRNHRAMRDSTLERRSLQVGQAQFSSGGNLSFVPVTLANSTTVDLSATCVKVLSWPLQNLATSGREDIVFLAFNIWASGMSFVAVLNESMPHMIAAVLTHLLLMAFSAFQIVATRNFRVEFLRITRDGACNGVNLLPNYWEDRQDIETAQLVLNVVAFIVSVWLSWKLIKQFGWQTFKRVGANMGVNRMYKLVLGLSVVLQLSIFFVVASVALWVEQICIGAASFIVHHKIFYEVTYLIVLIFLFPWAACGWFGVRRESKLMTHIFIGGTVLLLASWGAMFASSTFRLLVQSWKFFATLTIISIILLCCVLVLTVACRLQFGKHAKKLTNYLNHDDEDPDVEKRDFSDQFNSPTVWEKVEFPGDNVPTYESVTNPFANNAIPPRFLAAAAASNPPPYLRPLQLPAEVHMNPVMIQPGSSQAERSLMRSPSQYSQGSQEGSPYSSPARSRAGSTDSSQALNPTRKNWVIE